MEQEPESRELEAAREVMDRAIRRLNVLEYLILAVAVGLALMGGALVGWLLSSSFGLPFRWGWAGASLLLFLIPGGVVYLREIRQRDGGKAEGRGQGDLATEEPETQPKDLHG